MTMDDKKRKLLYVVLAFLSLSILTQLPIWMVQYPPLVDYPNHLARMHIISNIDDSPILQKYYSIQWQIVPNLAMDIIVPVMAKFMPLETAGKIFIGIIFFLLSGGTLVLHYSLHRKISFLPLIGFMFLYNRIFLWGFLNYLFGVALMLWVFSAWIYFEQKSIIFKIWVFILPVMCLFFSHLHALGVYGVCVISYESYRHWNKRMCRPIMEWGAALLQFVLPSILFLFFSPTYESVNSHNIIFGDIERKIVALSHPLLNYSLITDIISSAILIGLFLWGISNKKIFFSRRLCYTALVLFFVFLGMPKIIFTAHGADTRIPAALIFLLVSAIEIPQDKNHKNFFLPGLLLMIFLIRMGIIVHQWKQADSCYAQHIEAIEKIDLGSRLFTVVSYSVRWNPFPIPLAHFPGIAVIKKSAFVPSLFAYSTQQPLRYHSDYKELVRKMPSSVFEYDEKIEWSIITKSYDYILIINEPFFVERIPLKYIEIYRGNDFRLFKVR